jgi:type IV secretory pathway ATPase VirB11/archaellum biosynthesis ATPase
MEALGSHNRVLIIGDHGGGEHVTCYDRVAIEEQALELVELASRHDAERIVVDPVDPGDAYDLVALALNGFEGSITTHRGRSAEALRRRLALTLEFGAGASLGDRAEAMVQEAFQMLVVLGPGDHPTVTDILDA